MKRTPSLTAVVHAVVKDAPSKLDAHTIASLLGKPYQTLMSELSNQPGHKFGADLVLDAMNLANSDEPVHFLARQRGGVFIKLPQADASTNPIQIQCMAAVKEFGELMAELGADLSDNSLSVDECDRIEREGHESVTATMALLKLVADIRRAKS